MMRGNSLIIAGFDTPPVEQLFGKQVLPPDGIRINVQQHPYNLTHQQQFDYQIFDYFLQSQLLWDETMAQTAHQYLSAHPKTKLIINRVSR